MQDVIVSLNGNVLKVTSLFKNEFKSSEKELSHDIVEDSKIIDVEKFSVELSQLLNNIIMTKKNNFRLNFVVEPEDMYFRFVTVSKNDSDLEQKILTEIQGKLDDVKLADLYYSYLKIAPFVYQFVGTKKTHLDNIVEVSNKLNLELHSVLPWVLLLPKYVGANNSSIFVCHIGPNPSVVLSEMGGVFFVGSYDENEDPERLNKLVTELSVYKRVKPIDSVYTFNYSHLKDVDGLKIQEVAIPNAGQDQTKGFEANLLASYMLDLAPDTILSQANLLNTLPLPVVVKKQMSLAPVGAVLMAVMIFGGFLFYVNQHKNNSAGSQVLGEGNATNQNLPIQTAPTVEVTPPKVLDRKDLVIRIENGSGITGMASKTQGILEKLGYKVLEIDTADETRDSTLFKFKNTKSEFKDLLNADLKDYFPTVEVEENIDTSNTYDVLIIVGTSQKLQ